jgi:hypothetical protein
MIGFDYLGQNGRLANQMFQYAALRGIASYNNYDFCIPKTNFNDEWKDNKLFDVFELSNLKNIGHIFTSFYPEKQFRYDDEYVKNCPDNISLHGYYQSEKYFNHIENDIRKDFTFHSHIFDPCEEMISEIDSPISLHVRRTDYITDRNHTTLDLSYYEQALNQFDLNRTVIVFSDDTDWCKTQNLFSSDRFMISENIDNAIDLCLMTLCSDHIIANSSFSWWGAWLANSNKVISPSTWFGPGNQHLETQDLIPENWTII